MLPRMVSNDIIYSTVVSTQIPLLRVRQLICSNRGRTPIIPHRILPFKVQRHLESTLQEMNFLSYG
jgi:hypothetical protein